MCSSLAQPERFAQYVFYSEPNVAVGFVEASLRRDYVPGTDSSPVAFLEGIYVAPTSRRRGVAIQLVIEVEGWARAHGCAEFASDTQLENGTSQLVHKALGFHETERIVCFAKSLR
jgi:aminoglycoside 6'-N-acetyltransferase I